MSNPEVYNEYKTLLTLYNKYGALKWGQLVAYPADDVMLFEKRYENQNFLIVVNVRNREVSAYIPKEWQEKKVTDMMHDKDKQLPSTEITIQPYEYFILKK
jgi:glycosidase